jgi:ATP-dependent helicase HepA
MDDVFDAFGIDSEKHSEHSLVLHPSDHMRVEQFPGLPESGLTITYQRQQALSREDMQFVTWEHPLVRGAQDLIALTEFGNTAFCTLKLPPLKPGNLMLEAIFILHCPAPAELQLFRHMPQSMLRVLMDQNGKDLGTVLGIDKLSKLLQKIPRNNAQELVRHARPVLVEMLQKAEDKAKPQQTELIAAAQQKVRDEIMQELDRMQALAAVNPNVRQSEIDYLQESLAASLHYLSQAKLRLDSLRVIMTV